MRRTRILRIYPNAAQRGHLRESLRLTRQFYNACLEQRRHHYAATGSSPSAYDQIRELPAIKRALPEFREPAANVLQATALRLEDAFRRFLRGQNAYPRFKAASRWNSLTYPHRRKDFRFDGGHLVVAKLGRLRCRGPRPAWIDAATQRRLVLKCVAGAWSAHVTYDVADSWTPPRIPPAGSQVGVDLGIRTLAALSDGTTFQNPKNVARAEKRLRRMQRSLARKKPGSANRAKNVRRVQRQHARVRARRLNHLHHVTRRIAEAHALVAMEDLRLQGLVRARFAKHQHDAAWGIFRRLLAYKVAERGGLIVRVDPRGTSQECHQCGARLDLRLQDRVARCAACGLRLDRDVNAARNVLARALTPNLPRRAGEFTPADTGGRRGDASIAPVPVKEAGTAKAF